MCRWIGVQVIIQILLHGILYHVLWATESAKMYRDEAFRFSYAHYYSNGGGLVSWIGALLIAITAIPWFRRHMYWVRQCGFLSCYFFVFTSHSFIHLCNKEIRMQCMKYSIILLCIV
jgi:hypothetical protein